jgi:acetyl-CoA acyltransferase
MNMQPESARRRAVIVSGRRSPFVKANTQAAGLSAVDLAARTLREVVAAAELSPDLIDQVICGCVLPSVAAPNVAREAILQNGLPRRIPGFTLNRACASSLQAAVSATEAILAGSADVVVAMGVESLSQTPITYSRALLKALQSVKQADGVPARMKALADIPLGDLLPAMPAIAEASTGLSMGQHADRMARRFGVSRRDQDEWALTSHKRAADAQAAGRFAGEIHPLWASGPDLGALQHDTGVRPTTTLEALAALKPVFDPAFGTVTAGNASPLTDGAAGLLIMDEAVARQHGYTPLVAIRAWATAALDPADELLIGPALAIPKALQRAGLTLADMAVFELHEAFAAQVLSTFNALESPSFARDYFGGSEATGQVDRDKVNVDGGSIALGHPFGATGARLLLHAARTMVRTGGEFGLAAACAAGAQAMAVVLERV